MIRRDDNFNVCAEHVTVETFTQKPQAQPVILISDSVQEEPRHAIVICDEHIRVAVVVDVSESRAATDLKQTKSLASLLRDFKEASSALVMKELVRLPQRIRVASVSQIL